MDQPSGSGAGEELAGRTEQLLLEFSKVLPRETIERVVEETSADFRDARVKTYVPILIERFARDRLKAYARAGDPGRSADAVH